MKLSDALKSIAPARGMTIVIEAVIHGNESVAAGSVRTTESLTEARAMREAATRRQQECQSDWEYSAHQGDISYWSAVCSLLEAAQIVGDNSLPEIPFAVRGSTVMERCSAQQTWSEQVLTAAKAIAQLPRKSHAECSYTASTILAHRARGGSVRRSGHRACA